MHSRMCRFAKPCTVELRHPDTGEIWGECSAYATGHVVSRANKRLHRDKEPHNNMHYSTSQMVQRDRAVEASVGQANRELRQGDITREVADKRIEAICMAAGSRGQTEHDKSGLGYWDVRMHAPFAVYHCLYLGIAKDFLSWILVRLGVREAPKEPLVSPFKRPKDVKKLLQARRLHFVLRSKPDCVMVDFTAHLGSMSMSEMQLLYEVGVPYFCHDLASFGVPQEVVVMWLLLRHGMMLLTRVMGDSAEDAVEYTAQVREARACLFAFAATAEHLHSTQENRETDPGLSQFKFTWKLHASVCHLCGQAFDSGHAQQSSDCWVERLMRHKACQICKCAPPAGFPMGVLITTAKGGRGYCLLQRHLRSCKGASCCSACVKTCACAGTGWPRTLRMPSSSRTKTTTAQRRWRWC
jgi:hypothetical protein